MENINNILEQCKDLSLQEIYRLREELSFMYRDKFEASYRTIHVYPGERLVEKIKEETGFHCYHKPSEGYSSGRGTHVIVVPIEKYTDQLVQELTEKYNIL